MSPSRRPAALFAALAALLAAGLTLGLVEVVLRVVDYPPATFSPWIRSDLFGFRLAPDIDVRMRGPEYDVRIQTNSLGMRDDEPGPKNKPRVMLIGDSFAMGYGVERGKLFADLLEKDLGIDVEDMGTGGYEIVQQPRVLAEYGPRLSPDLVLYAMYLGNDLSQNDEWEERADGSLHNKTREYPVRQPNEWKLVRLVHDGIYGIRKGRSEKEGEWLPYEGYLGLCEKDLGAEAIKDYADAEALLVRVAEQSRRLRAPLLVLEIPYRSMVEPDAYTSLASKVPGLAERYDLTQPAREIGQRMTKDGIEHVDVTPNLVEEFKRSAKPLFYPIDGHLTEAGHAAVARFLEPYVRDHLRPDADRHL
ncbi:MAG TPA: SGNH/GDSL hydrolase family protein [Candidatus Binatia bacterium]